MLVGLWHFSSFTNVQCSWYRDYIYIYIQYIFGVDTFDAQETFASVVFQSFKAEPS